MLTTLSCKCKIKVLPKFTLSRCQGEQALDQIKHQHFTTFVWIFELKSLLRQTILWMMNWENKYIPIDSINLLHILKFQFDWFGEVLVCKSNDSYDWHSAIFCKLAQKNKIHPTELWFSDGKMTIKLKLIIRIVFFIFIVNIM